jgi:hypothetical protein
LAPAPAGGIASEAHARNGEAKGRGQSKNAPPCAGHRLGRRLLLAKTIDGWSLTSLLQRLVKTGGRLIKRARYYWLWLAEGRLHRRLFGRMLRRIWALPVPNG